jgi:hypothetical protein
LAILGLTGPAVAQAKGEANKLNTYLVDPTLLLFPQIPSNQLIGIGKVILKKCRLGD